MRIAAVQMDVTIGQPAANLTVMLSKLQEAAAAGAKLICFPECALTGYCFESVSEAMPFAQTLPGPATEQFTKTCRELDTAFPEAPRSLAILGADLIVLPTNWPPGAECVAEHTLNTRAMENAVYFLAVNRVGEERGFSFIGRSRICGPSGCTLASTESTDPTILFAAAQSRNKRVTRVPGKHAIDRLADRRPEMYDLLTQPHSLRTPRDDANR
ncbi:MAG: nitrilase/cyanide hydratase and apolipoprotein N-acyltransferase [Planctomycetota bacterium]|nr:MAG: nitrilase/cyanide hydratase and apolipoprotein N-acyltransferase [Planctomycetota bacterium]